MKRLDQLTMAQYIEVAAGEDLSALGCNGDEAEEQRLKLMGEYASLSDPVGTAAYVSREKRKIDARASLLLFRILSNMLAAGFVEDVRSLLSRYGISAARMTAEQISAEVGRRLARAKTDFDKASQAEEANLESDPTAVRGSFRRQAASLMAFFRFQIDLCTIDAASYACLVAQAFEQSRRIEAEMRKK